MWVRQPELSRDLKSRISVTLIDDSDSNDEILAQMQDFDWTIKKASSESLTLAFTLNNPSLYG